jgi:hypothetical protein
MAHRKVGVQSERESSSVMDTHAKDAAQTKVRCTLTTSFQRDWMGVT